MKTWISIIAITPMLIGCMIEVDSHSGGNSTTLAGNGYIVAETRHLSGFWSIETHDNINVEIKIGTRYEAIVVTDDNLSSFLYTGIEGNRLVIEWARVVRPTSIPTVRVTLPLLEGIHNYGKGRVDADLSIWHKSVGLEVTSSGSIYFTGASSQINAYSRGSGVIDLMGYTDDMNAELEGAGDILTDGMLSADVSGTNDGYGDLTFLLDDNAVLRAGIYGSGNVEWWGWPSKTVYTLVGTGKVIEHRTASKASASNKMTIAQKYKALKPKV